MRIFESASFALLQTLKLDDDADNLRFDSARKLVWAAYGGGALTAIDGDGKRVANIAVSAHPESFQIERSGPRIFVNVLRSRKIEVVDRHMEAIAVNELSIFPMALDEKSKRLFVVGRTPARLLVFDTDSGLCTASLKA